MKRNLLSILILVLMIVNVAMSAVVMMSVTSTNQKTAALLDSVLTAMNLELSEPGADEAVSLTDTETYNVGTMTVRLKPSVGADGSTKQYYVVFDIALLINKVHADYAQYGGTNMSQYDSMIKNDVERVVTNYTNEECQAEFSGAIRDEILAALKDMFHSEVVYGITLSNVKYGS